MALVADTALNHHSLTHSLFVAKINNASCGQFSGAVTLDNNVFVSETVRVSFLLFTLKRFSNSTKVAKLQPLACHTHQQFVMFLRQPGPLHRAIWPLYFFLVVLHWNALSRLSLRACRRFRVLDAFAITQTI